MVNELEGLVTTKAEAKPAVLVVDDDVRSLAAVTRLLTRAGYDTEFSESAVEALRFIAERQFDLVLTDIRMPGMDGLAFLREIRKTDPELPVILLTGHPGLETALSAVELGALHYFLKPPDTDELLDKVAVGVKLQRMARLARVALEMSDTGFAELDQPEAVAENLDSAMQLIWVAYQPVVHASSLRTVFGYEALLRCHDPVLRTPLKLLLAAKRLGRMDDLSATIQAEVARFLDAHSDRVDVFLNILLEDLFGDRLMDRNGPFSEFFGGLILEISEREAVDKATGICERVQALRERGYRFAIDDVGTGLPALPVLIALQPDMIKLDISLSRDIDASPKKQDLAAEMVRVCHELGVIVVAEGVETENECNVLVELGCDLVQGFWIARPAPAFPELPVLGSHLSAG